MHAQARGASLRSPEVLTPSQKRRDAEEEDADLGAHTSWGGRGKRGGVAPPPIIEAPPPSTGKRKRAQVPAPPRRSPSLPRRPVLSCNSSPPVRSAPLPAQLERLRHPVGAPR